MVFLLFCVAFKVKEELLEIRRIGVFIKEKYIFDFLQQITRCFNALIESLLGGPS